MKRETTPHDYWALYLARENLAGSDPVSIPKYNRERGITVHVPPNYWFYDVAWKSNKDSNYWSFRFFGDQSRV